MGDLVSNNSCQGFIASQKGGCGKRQARIFCKTK
jgi:hypothetical protein